MSEREANAAPETRCTTTKRVPCWVCGGDLMFNYVSLSAHTVTIHNYCPKCRKTRKVTMTVD